MNAFISWMNGLLSWVNDRTGIRDAWREYADRPRIGNPSWMKTLPSAIFVTFLVQAITGFFLWMYYSPSTSTAWESVYFLQYHVLGGGVLRAVHSFAAQSLLVLTGAYLLSLIVSGKCRFPREAVYWTALFMVLGTMASMLSGDLLAWNQNSLAATQVRAKFSTLLPWIGDDLYKLIVGGTGFGHLTLTRFLTLHIGLFGGGFLVLLWLHGRFAQRADRMLLAEAKTTSPQWPNQAARNVIVSLSILAVVVGLALWGDILGLSRGPKLGSPADLDPANSFAAARPEWAFLGLYEFAHFFPGEKAFIPIFIVPGALLLFYLMVPFFGRCLAGRVLNVLVTFALLIAVAGLSWYSLAKDAEDPVHQQALAEERELAERTILLAQSQGIPPTGALAMLRNDAKTEGRRLFKQNCVSCHNVTDGKGEGLKAEKSSAPNLHGFASREWIAGLLDPKQITTSKYFGDTKLRGGQMADFVKGIIKGLEAQEKKNLPKVVMALSAEAQLPSQREIDERDKESIEAGRKLLVTDFGCTDCHKFHDKGPMGIAPDLTGYGSKEWLSAVIANPASPRFYGKRNDRMPSYAETKDPKKNLLTPHSLKILPEWMHGEWFEENLSSQEKK